MVMKRQYVSLVLMLSVFFAQPVSAILIDFGPTLPGAPTGSDVILTNQLSGLGVTFSTTDIRGVVWHGPTGSGSFPFTISAGGICAANEDCSNEPIRVDIDSGITGAFSDVTIRGFDGGGDTDTMLMSAFDSLNTLLDTVTITDVYTNPGLNSTVAGANIAYVTFEVTGTTGNVPPVTGTHGLFFDDLCIGPCDVVPAPEPGTLGVLIVGLIGLIFVRHKRAA